MNVGEAMSKTDTWVGDCKEGSMGLLMNHFRLEWEKNNKKWINVLNVIMKLIH